MAESFEENYAKFLAGEPLNEDLAAVRDGRLDTLENPVHNLIEKWAPRHPMDDPDRDLTIDECALLKEAKQSGVLNTLIRLQRKALQSHVRTATIDSEKEPLARTQEIVQQWAYVTMFRRACLEVEALVEAEIKRLEGDEAKR